MARTDVLGSGVDRRRGPAVGPGPVRSHPSEDLLEFTLVGRPSGQRTRGAGGGAEPFEEHGAGAAPAVGTGGGRQGRHGAAQCGKGEQQVLGGDVGAHAALRACPLQRDVDGLAVVRVHGAERLDVRQTGGHQVVGAAIGRQSGEDGAEVAGRTRPGVRFSGPPGRDPEAPPIRP